MPLHNSPASAGYFTTLTANTPASGDNSTKVATTAFVFAAVDGTVGISTTGGTLALTVAQFASAVWLVTGVLTSNAILTAPSGTGVFTVCNRTTGAFTLAVTTSGGSGVVVGQGFNRNLIADGTNVVFEQSDQSSAGTVATSGAALSFASGQTILVVRKTTGSATAVSLPANPNLWVIYCVIDGKGDAPANNITVTGSAAISGQASSVLNVAYQAMSYVWDGALWSIV